MAKYEIYYRKAFRKSYKKLSKDDKAIARQVIERIANDEILEPKYKDHKLKGTLNDFRECHIKPDLLLIYEKYGDNLIMDCINIGNHGSVFKP